MRVLLTGGGTGGHLFPGMAIADALAQRQRCTLLFVGTRRGIEARIVPSRSIPFRTVWISGLHRGRLWGNMLFPIKMAVSLIQSLSILLKFRPDVVIGTGGYVTWPVMRAAVLLGLPTVLQEQNEAPGLVIAQAGPSGRSAPPELRQLHAALCPPGQPGGLRQPDATRPGRPAPVPRRSPIFSWILPGVPSSCSAAARAPWG